MVQAAAADDISLWLRRFHQGGPEDLRLVCFPHAGGSASYYHPLSAALADEADVRAVQYPGRQDRRAEAFVDDIPELARRLVPFLLSLADKPLALFGHSMGATVAFEATRILERDHGIVPLVLFASARCAPSRHRSLGIHQLDDTGVLAELRRLNGTDSGVFDDDELVQMVLPVLRNDYRAAETYRYADGPPIMAPVVGLVGDADPRVAPEEMEGWRQETTGSFESHVFPGGHFYLGERQQEVIDVLRKHLAAHSDGLRSRR